jgi:hypothetical protein
MADYFVIDADSHVEELEDAWNFLREKYRERRAPQERSSARMQKDSSGCDRGA